MARRTSLLCLLLLAPLAALAQETGRITGTVTDAESHGPIADVVVTAESPALHAEQLVVTDAQGRHVIESLPPAAYALRVGAQLRRTAEAAPAPGAAPASTLTFAGYRVDLARRTVAAPDGEAVELTRTEFDLLVCLVQHRERALRRDELLDAVWGEGVVVDPRTVDNFLYNLKRKLGWTAASRFTLLTVRGVGYRLEVDGEG